MADSPAGKILVALRKRLTDANYSVFLGEDIDTEAHTLPALTIFHGKDGDQVVKQRPRLTQEMDLVVECWIDAPTDPLLASYEFADEVREVIAPGGATDRPDYLNGLAHKVEYKQTLSITRDRKHATVQLRLSIQY